MSVWTFTVPGPIMGAVRTTRRQMWVDPRYKAYEQYKAKVRMLANCAGVPDCLGPRGSYSLKLEAHWERLARVDLDNVCKGALDALWKQDRRVIHIWAHSFERQSEEKAIVTVRHIT
jgi:Holliday junction resolvase RusA-like endonuclease